MKNINSETNLMYLTSEQNGISVGPEGQPIPARWEWAGLYDHEACMTMFVQYRETLAALDTSNIGVEDLARMFLLGCKYGRAYEAFGK